MTFGVRLLALRNKTQHRAGFFLVMLLLSFITNSFAQSAAKHKITMITVAKVAKHALIKRCSSVAVLKSSMDPVIKAQTSGQVKKVAVVRGQAVEPGQLLLELNNQWQKVALEAARINYEKMKLVRKSQAYAYQKLKRTTGLVSKFSLEKVTVEDEIAKKNIAIALNKVLKAQHELDKTIIRSPIYANIKKIMISQGSVVAVNDPIMQLNSNKDLYASFQFNSSCMPYLKSGQKLKIHSLSALDKKANKIMTQKVTSYNPETQSAVVVIPFDNNKNLLSGSALQADINISLRRLAIPVVSVQYGLDGKYVYVIKKGVANKQPVTTGLQYGKMIEIISGLKKGDIIAVEGAGFLRENEKVTTK